MLAYDTGGTARPRRGKLEAYTTRTVVDPAELAEQLAAIRSAGWASEFEEHVVEQAGIAAPIRGLGGLVVGAVGLTGPVPRICNSKAGTARSGVDGAGVRRGDRPRRPGTAVTGHG